MIGLKNTMIAAGLLALSSGAAMANPAVVTNDLHMRAGPGADTGIVGVLPRGADVQAWDCNLGWCRVAYAGREGFASESYLDIGRARLARPMYRDYAYAPAYRGAYAPPTYRNDAYAAGYNDYAYAPGYREYAYDEPSNPLDFPLLPWNWGRY